MMILALLAQVAFSMAKEARILSFPSQEIVYCGKMPSWMSVLPQLTSKEIDCMDAAGPLGNAEVFVSMPKEKFEIDRGVLVNILKKSRTECLLNSEWLIPSKISFQSQALLNESTFFPWLQVQLQNELSGKQIEVTKVQLPRVECAKSSQIKWGSFRLDGKNTFRFLLIVDEKNFGVTGEFRAFQNIPVVMRNFGPEEKIGAQDVEIQKRDVTFSPGFVSRIEDLVGRTLKFPVSQGTPVQIQHLKTENTIEKGQIIQAQYQGNNFILTSTAIAEQNGSVGDFVRIKNVDSQKTLSGIVLGRGLVEVQ